MDKYKKLENITNALQAAGKIKGVYKVPEHNNPGHNDPERTDENGSRAVVNGSRAVENSSVCRFCEALRIIGEYSPGLNRSRFGETIDRSAQYSNTYRNLKRQIRMLNSRGMNREALIQTLNVIKPLLSSRSVYFVDKISRIHEILKS